MRQAKIIIFLASIAMLISCSASGPIKAYDEGAVKDKNQLAIIYVPPELEVEDVDGVAKNTPFIESGYNEIHLLPGQHDVTVSYERFWGDAASGNMVSSKPVTLSLQVEAGLEYVIKIKTPQDQWQAEQLATNFKPWIESKSGQKLAIKRKKYKVSQTPVEAKSTTGTGLSAEEIVARQNPLEKLKFWWKLAEKKDRQAFQSWVKAQ